MDQGSSEIEAYVSSWRYLLSVEIASFVLKNCSMRHLDEKRVLEDFFKENYGSIEPKLADILRPKRLKLNKLTFQPAVLGYQLGGIDLDRRPGDLNLGTELDALTDLITRCTMSVFRTQVNKSLYIHFDELDHGMEILDSRRKSMLIGLILAVRDFRKQAVEQGISICPIIYLRTDLWDDLYFSDKNKLPHTLALQLEWNKDSLLDLIQARLRVKLAPKAKWNSIVDEKLMRGSQTKWNHIVARTLHRPRDVIHFLNVTLKKAQLRPDNPLILFNNDIVGSRTEYSNYLKKEFDDEIRPHWPQWDEALKAISSIATEVFSRVEFESKYNDRISDDNKISSDDALQILHRFSVIGYGRRSGYGGSGWSFSYEEPDAGWDSASSRFKVHPGLKEYLKLREKRR